MPPSAYGTLRQSDTEGYTTLELYFSLFILLHRRYAIRDAFAMAACFRFISKSEKCRFQKVFLLPLPDKAASRCSALSATQAEGYMPTKAVKVYSRLGLLPLSQPR